MYLSRLILNPRNRGVQRDLSDCHALHRTIMSAFPQAPPQTDARASFGVLHRLEPAEGKVTLLVQSSLAPDWSRLRPGYLMETGEGVENPACKPLDKFRESLTAGMELRFRLRANPTRKIDTKSGPNGEKNNGQRVPLNGEEAQLGWLRRKAVDAGFALLSVQAKPSLADVATMPEAGSTGRRQESAISISSVLFEGKLKVTDIQKFRQALSEGIGPGKAFGCGLLSVAPFAR